MRRLFYLAVGAGLGVAAVRKIGKAARRLTPSGLADSAGESFSGLAGSLRGFLDDVRAGMAQREFELNSVLVGDAASPGPAGVGRAAVVDDEPAALPASERER